MRWDEMGWDDMRGRLLSITEDRDSSDRFLLTQFIHLMRIPPPPYTHTSREVLKVRLRMALRSRRVRSRRGGLVGIEEIQPRATQRGHILDHRTDFIHQILLAINFNL